MLDDERIMSRRASREGGGCRDYAGRKGGGERVQLNVLNNIRNSWFL